MFCKNCGEQIPDNARFCPKCGASAADVQTYTGAEEPGKPEKKKLPKFLIPLIVVVAAAAVIVSLFGVRASNTINLNQYLEVTVDGFDGYATVNASINYDAIEDKYGDKVDVSWPYNSLSDLIWDSTYFDVEPVSGLSNGDEVTVTLLADTKMFKEYINKNMRISASSQTFTVADLPEAETFDAFDEEFLEIDFRGASPYIEASVVSTGNPTDYLHYTITPDKDLAIGDTVTVSIDESAANAYASAHDMIPEALEKEIVIEDVPAFVLSLDEVSEDGMEELEQTAEDEFNAYVSNNWSHTTLTSLDFLGSYLLCATPDYISEKDGKMNIYGDFNIDFNCEYLVYRYQGDREGETFTGYWYCRFDNLRIPADETSPLIYEDYNISTFSGGFIKTGQYFTIKFEGGNTGTYAGYPDLDSLFDAAVTSYLDNYTYESSVSE